MRTFLVLLLLIAGAQAQTPAAPTTAKPSPFNVDVVISTAARRASPNSYMKMMDIKPKVTISGVNRAAPLPAAEATLMIITMDTRAKYVGRAEAYKVNETETVSVPAATTGAPRPLTFAGATVSFDSYRDSSNVGGEVYKYYILGVRDPDTGEITTFDTNNTELAKHIKAHPEKRDEILKIGKGSKFPAQFK